MAGSLAMSKRSSRLNPSYEATVPVAKGNHWINPDPIRLQRKERLRRMRDDRLRGR